MGGGAQSEGKGLRRNGESEGERGSGVDDRKSVKEHKEQSLQEERGKGPRGRKGERDREGGSEAGTTAESSTPFTSPGREDTNLQFTEITAVSFG